VDLPEGKNMVGAFHQPRFVLADPDFLNTLPARELRAGLAEAVKTALISGPKLFTELRGFVKRHPELLGPDMTGLIEECVDFKAGIVEKDERESGPRRILNFGHTVGHALECLGGYHTLKHGEALFWGLSVALDLSRQVAGLDPRIETDIQRFLAPFLAALPTLDFDPREAMGEIARDKKVRQKTLQFVLLRGLGLPVVTPLADRQVLAAALERLRDRMNAGTLPGDTEIRE
jgi:3-dehydroquinate synthetase